ncbi:MAG TPA: hypothetical protein VGN20_12395 [Mucilaginibacter sp.]
MSYPSLQACIDDLEKHGHLIRIKEEVDLYLQMAVIHLRVFEHEDPQVFNLSGTLEISKFIGVR